MPASPALIRKSEGFGLTTAQIIYRVPDHHQFLQEFIWQEYDLCPHFPGLAKFLNFWTREIEGPLHFGARRARAAGATGRNRHSRRSLPPALMVGGGRRSN